MRLSAPVLLVGFVALAAACGGASPGENPPPGSDGSDGGTGADGADGTDGTTGDTGPVPWGAVSVDPDATPPDRLSEMNLLRWTGAEVEVNEGVVPYALNTPLFSDYTDKHRAIWLPEGTAAQWTEGRVLDFPVGTVITKTFVHVADWTDPDSDRRVLETRLLIHGSTGWKAWPYLWRPDGSDAELHVLGEVLTLELTDPQGDPRTSHYLVPQRNQCVDCHESYDDSGERVLGPIGPDPRFLDDGAWLQDRVADGWLQGAPDLSAHARAVSWADVEARGVDALSPDEVAAAARDYLHVNCAHCHSPRGIEGVTSQFFLHYAETDAFHLGVCKRPGSAGEGGQDREFDVVPGDPDQSILWYRTATEDVGAMMPDIGRSLTHDLGADLIWRWIAEMDPEDCNAVDLTRR